MRNRLDSPSTERSQTASQWLAISIARAIRSTSSKTPGAAAVRPQRKARGAFFFVFIRAERLWMSDPMPSSTFGVWIAPIVRDRGLSTRLAGGACGTQAPLRWSAASRVSWQRPTGNALLRAYRCTPVDDDGWTPRSEHSIVLGQARGGGRGPATPHATEVSAPPFVRSQRNQDPCRVERWNLDFDPG